MNWNSEDERLRRVLADAHEETAPSFDEVLGRARRRPAPAGRLWLPLAAAAALALAVTLPWLSGPGGSADEEAREFARQLAAWRAPSDALLEPYLKNQVLPGLGDPSLVKETDRMVRWRR